MNKIEKFITSRGMKTLGQHDIEMESLIQQNSVDQESLVQENKTRLNGIGCPRCGFHLMDLPQIEENIEGKRFMKCGCFRCGTTAWRRTP